MGPEQRGLNDSEKSQLKNCTELSSENAASLVRHIDVEVGKAEYSEVILINSFTNDPQEYLVSLNQASTITYCSCSYVTDSKSVYKHVFLAQSVFGYSMSHDIRLSKVADFRETSLPEPTTELSAETDARLESGEHAKALFLE